eukprot:scaffold3032_cov375-Prasinococcus_capsulatus_cf.AAC.20
MTNDVYVHTGGRKGAGLCRNRQSPIRREVEGRLARGVLLVLACRRGVLHLTIRSSSAVTLLAWRRLVRDRHTGCYC